jgi:hypothetical protein
MSLNLTDTMDRPTGLHTSLGKHGLERSAKRAGHFGSRNIDGYMAAERTMLEVKHFRLC